MRAIGVIGFLFVLQIPAAFSLAADPVVERLPVNPKFVVYASEENAEFGSSLFKVLRGNDKAARFDKADTIEKALASKAEVLVLVLPQREPPKLDKATLEALKQRKIIGIGYGAAHLFGQLGLEINGGACAHFGKTPPSLTVGKSELLGEPKNDQSMRVVPEELEAFPDGSQLDMFAVFLPPHGENASVVDAVARWTSDANYAPIVRQGNFVLIGIPVPGTLWSTTYTDLIREMCIALHKREPEAFSTARRENTKPGTYQFELAKRGSTETPFTKMFYFQFAKAGKFTAQLEHAGSNSVMLMFMGQDEGRTHVQRKDARNQETLDTTAEITEENIESLGDRYWVLNVTNFGDNAAECKLTITIEEPTE